MEISFKKHFLKEIEIAKEIFGIDKNLMARKGIKGKDILEFLSLISKEVWPERLKENLLPRPKLDELRGFYWGSHDVNDLGNVVCRQSIFYDKLLLLSLS